MEFTWRFEATRALPAGAFMWREDLDKLWEDHVKSFTTDKDDLDAPDMFGYTSLKEEPEDFRKINYNRHIKQEYKTLILEGFQRFMDEVPAALNVITDTSSRHQTESTIKEICHGLQLQGLSDRAIAQQLKKIAPDLSHNDIFNLLLAPKASRDYTYRHRCRLAAALLK